VKDVEFPWSVTLATLRERPVQGWMFVCGGLAKGGGERWMNLPMFDLAVDSG